MVEDKQIKELAEAIQANCQAGLFEDEAYMIADFVINKQGYCKSVPTGIVQSQIRSIISEVVINVIDYLEDKDLLKMTPQGITELKQILAKKYSGKDINVPTKEET